MKLTLGFSPCPNDTFIFEALVNQKVDTEGLEFDYFMADVEKLNEEAFAEKPDVTKLSFHAFLHLAGRYLLLDSGAALGFGAGTETGAADCVAAGATCDTSDFTSSTSTAY